ncbi:hypothetical protein Sste5346_009545 [Sporothrix stenoceras]|uniref:Ig-like domain-containing protein n=1 Tax=Sporothrix stenoceras TaxID=5173 RepID=A0ABR3YJD7_9PEZI
MKFPTTASILALGLTLVSPVVAANCKLSKPASVSPSSTSSVHSSSSSSAPSSSSSPAAPVCTNLVQNGDFADDASDWSLTGGNVFQNPCVGAVGCFDALASSDYTTSFSQTVTTVAGTTYNFNVDYYLQNLSGSITVVCTLTESVANGVTSYTVPVSGYNPGYFLSYTNTYTALTEETTLQCTMSTNGFAEVYFTGVSLLSLQC